MYDFNVKPGQSMILNVESGQRMILNVKSVQSVISMQNQAKVSTASLEFLPHGCTQFISNSSLTNWAAVDSTKASLYICAQNFPNQPQLQL